MDWSCRPTGGTPIRYTYTEPERCKYRQSKQLTRDWHVTDRILTGLSLKWCARNWNVAEMRWGLIRGREVAVCGWYLQLLFDRQNITTSLLPTMLSQNFLWCSLRLISETQILDHPGSDGNPSCSPTMRVYSGGRSVVRETHIHCKGCSGNRSRHSNPGAHIDD